MNDFEVEVCIVPLDTGFEPVPEKMIIRSVTTVSSLDEIFTLGEGFLRSLPEFDNDTGWA